jgi:NAD-dependent SIR2 family protein deacetylase
MLDAANNSGRDCFVFTSNVDGQFQKAGFSEDNIVECHGSIHHLQCTVPCSNKIWRASDIQVDVDEDEFRAIGAMPKCPDCGELARPNVLMFGDWHWIGDRTDDQYTRMSVWLQSMGRKRIAVIESGAGESVPTVRMHSERLASSENVTLIRINPRDYHVPTGGISIKSGALEGIEKIFQN